MGKIGEYRIRPTWRKQGRIPYQRVYRFKVSDPVNAQFFKLVANYR
jgi:hypothetical protein